MTRNTNAPHTQQSYYLATSRGEDVTSEVENEMQLEGNYCELLPRLESLLELSVIKKKPVFVSILREEMVSNYPYQAIRELLLNACMHRDMQSNTPLRFYEFASHLEILNAGGLYGNARPENFPSVNDYRNPLVASAMKTLGYVNMFNRGVGQVQTDLKENGNQPAEFNVNLITAFKVDVKVSQSYTKENGGKTGGDVVENIVENITENIVDGIVEKLSTTRAKIVRIIWKNPNATAQSISKEINIKKTTGTRGHPSYWPRQRWALGNNSTIVFEDKIPLQKNNRSKQE